MTSCGFKISVPNSSTSTITTLGNASALQLSGGASISVGACSPIIVSTVDSSGNPATVGSTTTVSLAVNGAQNYYSNSSCSTVAEISSLTLTEGQSSTTIWVQDAVSEPTTLEASATGLSNASLFAWFAPNSPTQLSLSGPGPVTTGTCSGAYTVYSEDSNGNFATPSSSFTTTIDLTSGGAVQFYSDPACTVTIPSVSIAAGAASASFYIKDSVTESALLVASTAGLTAGTVPLTVLAQTASKLVLSGPVTPATTAGTGTCSGTYTLQSEDLNGNPSPVNTSTVIALSGVGSGHFYSNSTCTTPIASVTFTPGSSSATIYFQDTTLQPLVLEAAVSSGQALTAGTLDITTEIPSSGTGLVFSGSPNPSVSTCTTYTVTNENSSAVATSVGASNVTINLAGVGSGHFYTTSACSVTTTTATITAGSSSTSVYFADASAQTITLTASAVAPFAASTGSIMVTVGTASVVELGVSGSSTPTAGSCTAYTVTSENVSNAATNVVSNTTVNLLGSGSGQFYSDPSCSTPAASITIASGSSSQNFYFKDTLAEALSFSASSAGLTTGSESVSVTAGSGGVALEFSGPNELPLSTCSAAFTVTALDTYRNAATVSSNTTVNLTGQAHGNFYSDPGCGSQVSSVTISSGSTSQVVYFEDATQETLTFTATAAGLGSAQSAAVTIAATSAVSTGSTFSCAVIQGSVWCWGNFMYGAQSYATTTPQKAPWYSNATSIATSSGNGATCVLVSGGVQCWGMDGGTYANGDLGNGTTTWSAQPTDVVGLTSGVTQIAAGMGTHLCAIQSGGAWCWGTGTSGQLGNASSSNTLTPVQPSGLSSGVTSIATGASHTCAIQSGVVYCWGLNSNGQLGNGSTTTSYVPVAVVGIVGTPTLVSAGQSHSCAVTSAGALYCWGNNSDGQLGTGNTTQYTSAQLILSSGVSAVSAGFVQTCAVVSGSLECWGDNRYGEVGNNNQANQLLPTSIGLSGATAVSTGQYVSCAIVYGAIDCWGYNGTGAIGMPAIIQTGFPQQVYGLTSGATQVSTGDGTACVVVSGGVQCWGGFNATIAGASSTTPVAPFSVTGLSSGATQVVVGQYGSICALASGGVQCLGYNIAGEEGNGTTTFSSLPVSVTGLSSGVTQITMSGFGNHVCALLSGGTVDCWGYNPYGQLGDGTQLTRLIPVAVTGLGGVTQVAAGSFHTCAVTSSGSVYCWGWNGNGQLGNGTKTNATTPVLVTGLPSDITSVTAGYNHSCALTSTGDVWCWGGNTNYYYTSGSPPVTYSTGQLGNDSGVDSSVPVKVQSLSGPATSISAGWGTTCAVIQGGTAQCWGDNFLQQLGEGSQTANSYLPVTVAGLTSVSSISVGAESTCAVLTSGEVQCWGANQEGVGLGLGTPYESLVPVEVELP